jgi:starch synthase (maltosyl-transferring)
MVVSFDPFAKRSGFVNLDLDALGLGSELELRDLVGGASFRWSGARNYVELDPHAMPAHVFSVKKVP